MNIIDIIPTNPSVNVIDFRANDLIMIHDEGTQSSWVLSLPLGKARVWSKTKGAYTTLDVTPEVAQGITMETNRLIDDLEAIASEAGRSVIYPPILCEHTPDGRRYGDKLRAHYSDAPGHEGMWEHMLWKDDVWEQIQKGNVQYVSVGIVSHYHANHGEDYGPVADETSITSSPRFRNIGSIQDALKIRFSDGAHITEIDMTKEELKALLVELLAELGFKPQPQEEPEEVEASEEEEEVEASEEEPEEVKMSDVAEAILELADHRTETNKALKGIAAQLDAISKAEGNRNILAFSETGGPGDLTPPEDKDAAARKRLAAAKESGLTGIAAINASRSAK